MSVFYTRMCLHIYLSLKRIYLLRDDTSNLSEEVAVMMTRSVEARRRLSFHITSYQQANCKNSEKKLVS